MGRKKSFKPMKDLYAEWTDSLRSTLLPLLRHSLHSSSSSPDIPVKLTHSGGALVSSSSDLLRTHIQSIHSHFQAYYASLDLASRHDPSQLLSPDWRSPLEKPFLFLGDLHPQLFTNLLRSLLNPNPNLSSPKLLSKIDQIDRGLRLIIPSINQRFRDAQSRFVVRIAEEWAKAKGKEAALDEAVREEMEELGGVFADANRARRSVLAEIVGAVDDYLGAIFLEALSELVVGFWDADLLHQFQQCRVPLSQGSP